MQLELENFQTKIIFSYFLFFFIFTAPLLVSSNAFQKIFLQVFCMETLLQQIATTEPFEVTLRYFYISAAWVLKISYVKQLTLMKCSLASAPVKAQQMQFLFLGNFKRSILKTQETVYGICHFEKAFNRVSRKVLWWVLCVACIPEW